MQSISILFEKLSFDEVKLMKTIESDFYAGLNDTTFHIPQSPKFTFNLEQVS